MYVQGVRLFLMMSPVCSCASGVPGRALVTLASVCSAYSVTCSWRYLLMFVYVRHRNAHTENITQTLGTPEALQTLPSPESSTWYTKVPRRNIQTSTDTWNTGGTPDTKSVICCLLWLLQCLSCLWCSLCIGWCFHVLCYCHSVATVWVCVMLWSRWCHCVISCAPLVSLCHRLDLHLG